MKARVYVSLKNGVLDPQGKAIAHALQALGFDGAEEVRVGRFFEVSLKSGDKAQAESLLKDMSGKLLANPVIEDFRVEML